MEVRLRTIPPMRVAYTAYEGPLDKVGSIFDRLQDWMRQRDRPDAPIIGVFVETRQPLDEEGKPHGAPDGTAEAWIEYDGIPSEDDLDPEQDPEIGIKDVPGIRVASTVFEGHPLDLIALQDQLRRFLRQQGLKLGEETRFVYLEADFGKINQWKTEVQVPVVALPAKATD